MDSKSGRINETGLHHVLSDYLSKDTSRGTC